MRIVICAMAVFIIIVSTIFYSQYARAQNLLTPRDEMLTLLGQASENPGHALWFYIAGLIGGANAVSVLQTGHPMVCDTHEFENHAETEETIMRWLLSSGQLSNPEVVLELVAPLAFADRYPCTAI